MYTKDVLEDVPGTFSQNNFTVDETRLKDVLNEIVLVEDRQAIRHENKDVAAGISFPVLKRTFERKLERFGETRVAFKRRDWQGQSRPASVMLHTHAQPQRPPPRPPRSTATSSEPREYPD